MEKNWYAVYTKPRWEKKIAETLAKKGYENYCPLNRVLRQWHDRKKIVFEPLFTSYVFVRAEENVLSEIRKVDGIINFVYWLRKPAIIQSAEIDTIKKFLNDYSNVQLEKVPINVYDKVRILSGPLMDQKGQVIAVKSKTIKLLLPSLGYMMYAEVEFSSVEIINSDRFQYAINHQVKDSIGAEL